MLRPNVILFVSIVLSLIITVVGTILIAIKCMHSRWTPEDLKNLRHFREKNLPLDFHHSKKEVFEDDNIFHNYESNLIEQEEDDLDHLDLDI